MESPSAQRAAAIRFFTPEPGKIKSIHGIHRWRGLPGVINLHLPLKEGDTVDEIRDSFTRSGYVLASAATATQAMELCNSVIQGITIDMA